MIYWAEYLNERHGKLENPLGSDSVVRLDGRKTLRNMMGDAVRFNGPPRPTYEAYRILRGQSIRTAKPVTNDIRISSGAHKGENHGR